VNEAFFKDILGEATWYLIGLAVLWFARGFIEELLSGLMMLWGNDVNLDDNLLLGSDERRWRVIRMTVLKTIFHGDLLDGGRAKMIIRNSQLKALIIKKRLVNGKDEQKRS
jgi:hypothetical protein